MRWSALADTMRSPLKLSAYTGFVWPTKDDTVCPVAMSHTTTSERRLPTATNDASGAHCNPAER